MDEINKIRLPFDIKHLKWGLILLPHVLTEKEWAWMLEVLEFYKDGIVTEELQDEEGSYILE